MKLPSFSIGCGLIFLSPRSTLTTAARPIHKVDRIKQRVTTNTQSLPTPRQRQQQRQRNLDLKCPPSLYNPNNNDDDYYYNQNQNGHRFDAYSKGAMGRKLISKLRGKSKHFYQSVVDNFIMALCDVETLQDRCVPANSSLAAKDWNGMCLVASDHVCPVGTCERSSNCYWNAVESNQNRTTRYPPENYGDSAKEKLYGMQRADSYARGVIRYGVLGIVLSVLCLISWMVFFMGRYCCCCLWTSCRACYLCSPIPKEEGYSVCRQWVLPSLGYIVVLAGIAVTGALSFVGNEDIGVAATVSFAHLSGLVEDLGTFLGRSRMPLENVRAIANFAAQDAKTIFDDTEYVEKTAFQIVSAFADFGDLHGKGLKLSRSNAGFDSALTSFRDRVTPVVDDIQFLLDTLENDLYENVDTIQSALGSAVDQIDSFHEQTDSWQGTIREYESRENGLRPVRKIAILGIFALSLVVSTLGLLGILASKRNCCKCSSSTSTWLMNGMGMLSAILASVALALASVTLTASFLWYDACEISGIVTSDFEPFLGERIARGANAIFDNSNLAVAFNVTDKVDFQAKLDEGLEVIEEVNITKQFQQVVDPLENIQALVDTISTTAVEVFNYGTTANTPTCPFNDEYTEENILEPWTANELKQSTSWVLRGTGSFGTYDRLQGETPIEYVSRLYNAAGICQKDQSQSCCRNGSCGDIGVGQPCNSGTDCFYACSDLADAITAGYRAFLEAHATERNMTADLGVKCPDNDHDNKDEQLPACPTVPFRDMGNDQTLVALIESYGQNITGTADDLVNIATTSVGEAMDEVQDFLCHMNISFVASRYDQVRDQVCETMLGGFAQVNWALWALAIGLEITAILLHLLSTRLKGLSKKEVFLKSNAHNRRISLSKAQTYG